jgi:putative SOS response-associated peptidase YedK
MCGRFTQKSERRVLQDKFFIQEFSDHVVVSYNVAPGQKAGVVINDGRNRYVQFTWGLVPAWADDPKVGSRMINARGETVTDKPSFRRAFEKRRCIVPADGFYEWQKKDTYKAPFYIYRRSGKPFGLAGLWERWVPKDTPSEVSSGDRALFTFTIITIEASPVLKELHDRMPVIVPEEKRDQWLSGEQGEETILVPYRGEDLAFHEVSRYVNSPENNSPECIQPLSQQ